MQNPRIQILVIKASLAAALAWLAYKLVLEAWCVAYGCFY